MAAVSTRWINFPQVLIVSGLIGILGCQESGSLVSTVPPLPQTETLTGLTSVATDKMVTLIRPLVQLAMATNPQRQQFYTIVLNVISTLCVPLHPHRVEPRGDAEPPIRGAEGDEEPKERGSTAV